MTTVLFVHGTGVREPEFSKTFSLVEQALRDKRPDLTITPCYWGGSLGAQLPKDARSIPDSRTARGTPGQDPEAAEIARWAMLYQDPFYELRLWSFAQGSTSFVPGRGRDVDIISSKMDQLSRSPELQVKLVAYGLSDVFPTAISELKAAPEYRAAFQGAVSGAVVARALVALTIVLLEQRQQDSLILTDATARDQLVELVQQGLALQERSLGLQIGKKVVDLALALGVMNPVARRRRVITDAVYPFAGDILLYQARGDAIRAFLNERIIEAVALNPPVVLIAHSLGGIACVDLCVATPIDGLELLVTVGSQAPFLYEIGALQSLRAGEQLPQHMPPWLNIYDPRDLLSYSGAGVFQGDETKVTDVRVDNRQPFPRAHSAYWTTDATWQAILPRIP